MTAGSPSSQNLIARRRAAPSAPACSRVAILLASLCFLAPAAVPRQSAELAFTMPSGEQRLLSSFKGKVVLIEFLLTNCPHCVRVAPAISRLYGELSGRGFQPLGIAFDTGITGPTVANFSRKFSVAYPVGYTTSDQVDRFLGRAPAERFQVPQIVIIDRSGTIRAQSGPKGDRDLEREPYLRDLIKSLL